MIRVGRARTELGCEGFRLPDIQIAHSNQVDGCKLECWIQIAEGMRAAANETDIDLWLIIGTTVEADSHDGRIARGGAVVEGTGIHLYKKGGNSHSLAP